MVRNNKIALTTSLPDLGLYFIESLIKKYDVEFVIIQLQRTSLKAKIKESLVNFIPFIHKYFYYKKLIQQNIFFNKTKKIKYLNKIANKHNIRIIYTYNINTDSYVEDVIKKTTSEYMLVLGGNIITEKILRLSKMHWLNGHGGILPEYRGLCSEYWAIINKDYEKIGNTIHYLTEKIDMGDIISVKTIKLEENILLYMLEAQNHLCLINNYLDSLNKLINNQLTVSSFNKENSHYYSFPKNYVLKQYLKVGNND